MKKILIVLLAPLFMVSCVQKSEETAKTRGNELYFSETTYDYGEIEEGSDGLYTIEFKNIGEEAILINKVRSSCGCTVPSWPKNPIEPGENGEIEVKYNTANIGSFMKTVTVFSSASNSPVTLKIKGKVVSKEITE